MRSSIGAQERSWRSNFKNPIGKVVRIIGDVDDHNTEINAILFDYGFASDFPKSVEDTANKIDPVISKKEFGVDDRRRNVRYADKKIWPKKCSAENFAAKKFATLKYGRTETHFRDTNFYVLAQAENTKIRLTL